MRYLKHLWICLLLAPLGMAQVSNPSITIVASPPSGSCSSNLPDRQVAITGALYSCQNGTWGAISGGGGGGSPGGSNTDIQYNNSGSFGGSSLFTFNSSTGVVTASGYATGASTQGFLVLQQNASAAPTQPANSFEFLAPQSGLTSSYNVIVPLLAPTDAYDVMEVPTGGGQAIWAAPGDAVCGSNNIPCTNTANTFSAQQLIAFGNPYAQFTDTNTSENFQIGLFSGYAYFSAPGSLPGFISFTGFGSTPTVAIQDNGVFGWNGTANIFAAPDTGLSRASAGVLDVGNGALGNASGTLNAAGYEAGGTPGVTKTCATAIVVVGGIITGCS